jgi:hypothetical protein
MKLKPRFSRNGKITSTSHGWQLAIFEGPSSRYRLSQLDDYLDLSRSAYRWHPPVTFSLRARISSPLAPGTWGFGLWNDPFGFSFFPGESFFRPPVLPNSIWFFYASSKNYLSFRNEKPAQGFLAQVFQSPRFHPTLLLAGLVFPFSRKSTRRILSRVIDEDSANLNLDVTKWHVYRLEWGRSQSTFWVDESLVFQSRVSPRAPLGIVIWIDNQYAAFRPDGKLKWGLEKNPQREWLEIEQVEINNDEP